MTRLHELYDRQRQSPWLDNLKRGYLTSGELQRQVDAGTRGVTLGAGKTGTIMSNQAGVIVRVSSTQQGIAVNATGGGVDMQLK